MARRHLVLAALSAGTAVVAAAAPAHAVTATCTGSPATCVAGVPVSLVGLGGTRQFSVEDVSGADLESLDLGTGGAQPFRTHVVDTGFTATGQSYSVSATMTNLYLRQGSGHAWSVKVPSSEVSIGFGSNPLSGSGISLTNLPGISVTGTLGSCSSMPSSLKSALGLSALGVPLDLSNVQLTALCTLLGATGGPVSATVDGALQTVTPAITSLADLPTPLSGATGGTFTSPSFAAGTVGADDPAATGAAPTSVPIMSGGPLSLSAGLTNALTSGLEDALSGLPLVSATDTGAQTTLAAALAGLTDSSNALTSTLGSVLSTLDVADQVTVLNALTGDLVPPAVGDILSLNGHYYAFPILRAAPTTPVPGTYDGTLTVTFVQS